MKKLDMAAHACDPSIGEMETEGTLRIPQWLDSIIESKNLMRSCYQKWDGKVIKKDTQCQPLHTLIGGGGDREGE